MGFPSVILSAQSIRKVVPISPFHEKTVVHGISFGLSSCGYDVRIDQDILMWPGRFALASTIEQFSMPDYLAARVLDKSSWARQGICVQNTFIEPGWKGYLTLEITNHGWHFRRLVRGMPIAQIIFEQLDEPTELPYQGKYQNQEAGPQPARYE